MKLRNTPRKSKVKAPLAGRHPTATGLLRPLAALAALACLGPALVAISMQADSAPVKDTPARSAPQVSETLRLELLKTARDFLDASTIEQRQSTCLTLPGLSDRMREWDQEKGTSNWSSSEIGSRFIRKAPFTLIPVRGNNLPSEELVLIDTPEGPKVDWEAFVLYQQKRWSGLTEEQWILPVEIRAQVEPLPNHHPLLSEAKGYRCFALVHPRTGQRLFAYADSAGDGSSQAVWKGHIRPMTLRVLQTEAMKGTLNVIVDEWVATGWSRYQP